MLKRYSIAEARKHLPGLVTEAETGTEVELTRRGEPVAVLLSLHEYERIKGDRREFSQAYAGFLEQFDLDEVGVEDDFIGELRDRGVGREVEV